MAVFAITTNLSTIASQTRNAYFGKSQSNGECAISLTQIGFQ